MADKGMPNYRIEPNWTDWPGPMLAPEHKDCCGRFGRGASLDHHRSQLFGRLWVRLPLLTEQFSEI